MDRHKVIRKKFEAGILRSASVPNPKIFYTHKADECIDINMEKCHPGEYVIFPHPDVSLAEFFSTSCSKHVRQPAKCFKNLQAVKDFCY